MMTRGKVEPSSGKGAPQRLDPYQQMRLLKEYEWLRTLAHVSPVGIFRADAAGHCTYVNERWTELTGLPAEEILGRRWEKGVHPDDVESVRERWQESLTQNRPFRFEHRCLHPNGRVVWVLSQVARELDGRGKVVGYVATLTEITELHMMRQRLQESHTELEERILARTNDLVRMGLIVDASDDAIFTTDLEGKILTWNRGAEQMFGFTAAEILGQSTLVFTPQGKLEEAHEQTRRVRFGESLHHFETMRMCKSGELIDVSISAFPLRDPAGAVTGGCRIVRNISRAKRSERQLRQLSWRLLRVQDQERRRLARELHDSTAQTLAALCMNLTTLTNPKEDLPEERQRRLLSDALEFARKATQELRTTAYLLHPPLLDERGLPAAIQWLADGMATRSPIQVHLFVDPKLARLSPEIETTLFRVVQESLLNAVRHSGSSSVNIRLGEKDGQLTLEIRDRGRGLPAEPEKLLGVGIAGMKERLLQLGGTLTVESNNPGTALIARLPINL